MKTTGKIKLLHILTLILFDSKLEAEKHLHRMIASIS